MISRDIRYGTIKPMISDGKIQTFSGIFKYIPFSVVADDLGKKTTRFKQLIARVEEFELNELLMIAKLCELTRMELFILIDNELAGRENKNVLPSPVIP